MASTILLSDNGVSSGTSGLKTTGGNDGTLVLQSTTAAGTATTAQTIGTDQVTTFAQAANLPNTFGFKNRLINGNMTIDQRNAGASVTPVDGQYVVDRWNFDLFQASKLTAGQNQGAVTPPVGFKNYFGVTSSSAYSVLSTDSFDLGQPVEGLNVADLAWGTANAATVTLSFWVRSSLTGTFGGAINNSGNTYNYPYSYTINSANTWEYKTVVIPGPTAGTWLTTNGLGLLVRFNLGAGSSRLAAAGSWTATSTILGATGQTSVVGTNGATWYVTGVQLEKGVAATSFDFRSYGQELLLCQRYFWKNYYTVADTTFVAGAVYSTGNFYGTIANPVVMRTAPTLTYSAAGDFKILGNGSQTVLTGITLSGNNPLQNEFYAGYSGGTVVGGNGAMLRNNNNNAWIAGSAEL